jgi:amino acid transporter
VPAVVVGSILSSRAPDKYIRPVITFVILGSGLKYAGLPTTALGWVLCGVVVAAAAFCLGKFQSRRFPLLRFQTNALSSRNQNFITKN